MKGEIFDIWVEKFSTYVSERRHSRPSWVKGEIIDILTEKFSTFLIDAGQRFPNHTATSADNWLDMVQFYSTVVRSLAGHTTVELRTRGKPGLWSKMHAVDCVLWSLVSLVPVRAIGAVYFFRGTRLGPAERAVYLGYRRRTDESLKCME